MRRFSASILGSVLFVSAPASALAQAYLGEPNSLSSSFEYTYAPSGKIIANSQEPGFVDHTPNVPEQVHIFNVGLQYMTPLAGLQAEVSLPLVAAKLGETNFLHVPEGEWD